MEQQIEQKNKEEDLLKVWEVFKQKHAEANKHLFMLAYDEAVKQGVEPHQMIQIIKEFQQKPVVVKTNSLATLLFKEFINNGEIFNKESEYSYLSKEPYSSRSFTDYGIKWENLLKNIFANYPKAVNDLSEYLSGKYDFSTIDKEQVARKIKASQILDFNTLTYLEKKNKININDLQLNVFASDNQEKAVGMKNLLTNKTEDGEYLIIQSSYSNFDFDTNFATMYSKWKLIDAFSTLAFTDNKNIKGICFINRDSNAKFSVVNKTFDELSSYQLLKEKRTYKKVATPEDYNAYLTTDEFKQELRKLYTYVNAELDKKGILNKEVNFSLMKDDIEERILKHDRNNQNTNLDVFTEFSKTKGVKYYDEFGANELTEEQKQYKFVKSILPSPSQINSLLYSKTLYSQKEKDLSKLEADDYKEVILKKYGLEQDGDDYKELTFDEASRERMDFGNHIELDIVRNIASTHPHLKINTDKRTLEAKMNNLPTYFDIDGYIGKDLNRPYQILEVKNSASRVNFENPENLVRSYYLQATYYDKLLKPQNGIKFLGLLSNGSKANLVEIDYKPTLKDKFELDTVIHNYLYHLGQFLKTDPKLAIKINEVINKRHHNVDLFANHTNIMDVVSKLPKQPAKFMDNIDLDI